jgi:hypothetical protein
VPQQRTTTPITPELVRGAVELEPTAHGLLPHRLPAWARGQCPDPQLLDSEAMPSGVRVAVRTAATAVELVVRPLKKVYVGAPARPPGHYDLVVDGVRCGQQVADGGDVLTIDLATGAAERRAGEDTTVAFTGLPPEDKVVEVWLPHNERTVLVSLTADAPVAPAPRPGRPLWVHHGSSISQGSDAASPSRTWPALAAAAAGVELLNLGYGGGALLDPFVARTIRDLPADLISLGLGVNVVNTDLMRRRAFGPAVHGFLDTIRDGHPETPLLVVSPIYSPLQEDTPGPLMFDPDALAEGRVGFTPAGDPAEVAAGKLTLRVVREELARVVEQRSATDPHLHLLDGLEVFGPRDHDRVPLPDGLHPDPAGHELIGERVARLAFDHGGPFDRG